MKTEVLAGVLFAVMVGVGVWFLYGGVLAHIATLTP